MPTGPAIVLVHVASTKVPFTSEAKEAIAPMEEIQKEVKLALQDAARQLGRHLAKKAKRAKVSEKFTLVSKILPEINKKASSVLGKPEVDLAPIVCKIMDVVWVEDPVVEYTKLEGQMLAPSAPKPQKEDAEVAADKAKKDAKDAKGKPGKDAKKGTLDSFTSESVESAPSVQSSEPPKPRQAFLAKGSIAMTNYMMGSKKFRFFVVLPDNAVFVSADPKPKEVKERYVVWDVPPLKPTEKLTLKWEVAGVDRGGVDDIDCFVAGINEVHVVGADPWHGGEE